MAAIQWYFKETEYVTIVFSIVQWRNIRFRGTDTWSLDWNVVSKWVSRLHQKIECHSQAELPEFVAHIKA